MSARTLRDFDFATGSPIRILIGEQSRARQWSTRALLQAMSDLQVIGTAASGREILSQTPMLRPDLVVMNFELPDLHGASVALRLRRQCPATRVLLIAEGMEVDPAAAQAGWYYGADGIVNADRVQEDLIAEIHLLFSKPEAA